VTLWAGTNQIASKADTMRLLFSTVFVLCAWGATTLFAAEHTTDSLETVKKSLSDGKAVLLDVREESEWNDGHLKDAKLLPLSKIKAGISADELTKLNLKDKTIYCHCGAGVRALKAADELKKLGYEIRPLKFGYADLLKEGFAPAGK
jgi:phage shock protein E